MLVAYYRCRAQYNLVSRQRVVLAPFFTRETARESSDTMANIARDVILRVSAAATIFAAIVAHKSITPTVWAIYPLNA